MITKIITDQIEYFNTVVDPRTTDKFLMSSPIPTICLVAAYLISVKYILPAYMRNRPAFVLKSTLFYYNLFQVIISAYLMYLSFCSGYVRRFSLLKCRDLDLSTTDPDALMAVSAAHCYFLTKFTEFLDTIFFVLRKKDSQVTFLHLFHHASMPFNSWLVTKVLPGGSMMLVAGVNSSVHVVMYTYYLLSSLGPQWQKYLWWKQYLTQVQLIQFVGGLFAILVILPRTPADECINIRKRMFIIVYCTFYGFCFLYLFARFYWQEYIKQTKIKERLA